MKNFTKCIGIVVFAAVITFSIASCGDDSSGDPSSPGHTHDFSGAWQKDATNHWKVCAADNEIGQKAAHAPADGVCTTCGYNNTPGHTHDFSGAWQKDATNHWKVCATDNEIGQKAAHAPANGICTTCSYDNTPVHNHDFSGAWQKDATNHWKVCAADGEVGQKAAHAPPNGICSTCGQDNTPHTHDWNWATYTSGSGLRQCQSGSCTETAGVGSTGPAGGKIIYANATAITAYTANYLEAAPVNQGTYVTWSSTYVNVTGAIGTAIGTGKANTAAIIAAHSSDTASNNAAKAAVAYTGGGKTDWFLPSKYELNEMYKAKSHLGISSGWFWSSSQYDYHYAWFQWFADGEWDSIHMLFASSVRAVRAF